MEIQVRGKQMDIGDALRQYVDETLRAITNRYFSAATDAHVTLSREPNGFRADIQVHVGRRAIVQAHGQSKGAYGAFEEALEHAAKRLRRHKDRLKDHKAGARDQEILPAQHYVLQEVPGNSEESDNDDPIIIAEALTDIESMSVSEAVMRMDLANVPALLFRSARHGGVNLVYRREDGHIGWVDPQASSGALS